MIFSNTSNYMLKYQKAKAKLVEYDIPQKDYPKFPLNFKQFFDLTLCNSANGGKACVYRLSRHLLYGKTTRI